MTPTNKTAIKLLNERTTLWDPQKVVEILIEGGFIKADPVNESEWIAYEAKKWLAGSSIVATANVFDHASGWSTDSWETVLGEKVDTPVKIRNVTKALLILAKEAGEI